MRKKFCFVLAFGLAGGLALPAAAQFIPQEVIQAGLVEADCDLPDDGEDRFFEAGEQIDAGALGGGLELVAVSCWGAAYNFGHILFAVDPSAPAKARLLRVENPLPPSAEDGVTGYTVTNFEYDPETKMLGEFAKGRGLGDCGSIGNWLWDGENFKLTGYWEKEECDGEVLEPDEKYRIYPKG
jgi:hypothetical protein